MCEEFNGTCTKCKDFYALVNNTCMGCMAGPVCSKCWPMNLSVCLEC